MSLYAIVETGSKQYRVEPETVLRVEKLPVEENAKQVTLDRVLFVSDGKTVQIGTPVVKGAKVVCDYMGPIRGKKLIAYHYRRRKASERKVGHRQDLIELKVKKIQAG